MNKIQIDVIKYIDIIVLLIKLYLLVTFYTYFKAPCVLIFQKLISLNFLKKFCINNLIVNYCEIISCDNDVSHIDVILCRHSMLR